MKIILKLMVVAACISPFACNNDSSSETADILPEKNEAPVQISQEVLSEMMQSLPQPIEIAQIISSSKMDISKSVLIPSDFSDKYEDKYAQALAFGAYGVDLGYINLNNKTLYILEYLEAIKTLAEKLKVNQFFDFQTLSNLAKNRNNTDSLIQLSTQNFNKIDKFLREQKRGELSVLILIGAWMEGMNMFCEIYRQDKSKDIAKRLGEQKVVFDNVVLLLKELNKIPFYDKLGKSFAPVKIAYERIQVSYKYNKPITQQVNGQLVIKDQTEMILDYKEQDIEEVVKNLQNMRNQYFLIK